MKTIRFACLIILLAGCDGTTTPPNTQYVYSVPTETGDGWSTASLSDVGLRPEPLEEMIGFIRDGSYVNIHGVLLIRDGLLVLEEYFPGERTASTVRVDWDRQTLHPQHSVTKSFVSALVGIAIDQGLISGVDQKLSTFFPEYPDLSSDPRKAEVTLHNMLTMTAGFDWEEWAYPYTDPRNPHVKMDNSGDPIGYVLGLATVEDPGRRFRYNSGLTIVLGEIVHRLSGMRTDRFAEKYLFGPLGITDYNWSLYPRDVVHASGGLAVRPRDMARLGLLFLNGGEWNGKRIISADWVKESTSWQTINVQQQPFYGYQWWVVGNGGRTVAPEVTVPGYTASGRGGQWIFVFPQYDLVAVFTGGNDNELFLQPETLLMRHVFPAIKR